MIGERTESALKRIDAALARIEQGSARLKAAGAEQAERHARLTAEQAGRHARLRDAVAAAMRDLDGLIVRAGSTLSSVEQAVEQELAAEAERPAEGDAA